MCKDERDPATRSRTTRIQNCKTTSLAFIFSAEIFEAHDTDFFQNRNLPTPAAKNHRRLCHERTSQEQLGSLRNSIRHKKPLPMLSGSHIILSTTRNGKFLPTHTLLVFVHPLPDHAPDAYRFRKFYRNCQDDPPFSKETQMMLMSPLRLPSPRASQMLLMSPVLLPSPRSSQMLLMSPVLLPSPRSSQMLLMSPVLLQPPHCCVVNSRHSICSNAETNNSFLVLQKPRFRPLHELEDRFRERVVVLVRMIFQLQLPQYLEAGVATEISGTNKTEQ